MISSADVIPNYTAFIPDCLFVFGLPEKGSAATKRGLEVLEEVGIDFRDDAEALSILKANGCDVKGERVRFPRGLCHKWIAHAPAQFTQHARNKNNSVEIGGNNTVFAPVYGPPFIRSLDGERRYATIKDFQDIVKLAYMSPGIHHSGGTVCEPVDLPVTKRHLEMNYSHMRLSDKPFMGSVTAPERAKDTIDMAKILFGEEFVKNNTVMISLINANSPMTWDGTMLGALKEYARSNQAVITTPFILSGAMAPVTPVGVLAQTLAEAMNTLGARSNSGEGGEGKHRYGTNKMSKIKQIASGRFGVTPHYLVNAEVLQIKIAQGAKPGEGGQLPGGKVNKLIAELRYSTPGVTLISPPPHHDIYSIEDLAQLIYDLKQVNPKALVSVKLVSEPGVGTIASGVAKAYADLITISGHDGGTGASPLTSIRYAGSPWELGLAEAHQSLRDSGLRHKVRLQTDGGMKTGLDVVKAAILGAESFGFGTGPMIAMGCKYLRICHLNNCATGVATQREDLINQHFIGEKQKVINYFEFIANDVRQHLREIGVSKLEDIIGQTHYLEQISDIEDHYKKIDLSGLLETNLNSNESHFCTVKKNKPWDKGKLSKKIMVKAVKFIDKEKKGSLNFNISNRDRSIGASVSGYIAEKYGENGLKNTLSLNFKGSAGQSFGCWNANNLNLTVDGDANDYVGKGMNGGRIVVKNESDYSKENIETVLVGNTCLYGATGGEIYVSGSGGERFAVRNSGANAVIEGVGDHCCEYMTGGHVTILGPVGSNFGAGMTGGFAYVLDEDRTFFDKCNRGLVNLERITTEEMQPHRKHLKEILEKHYKYTKSNKAKELLNDFYDIPRLS